MCEMDKIIEIAKRNKISIIEDCAQSQGAKYKKKYAGTFGKLGCFLEVEVHFCKLQVSEIGKY
jgi:dTDP-4-amino-4,6-dideoxygalactose transaminase